jgi:molybdate transport repressor ModE-like protein
VLRPYIAEPAAPIATDAPSDADALASATLEPPPRGSGEVLQGVYTDNIRPLRLKLLLEIEKTGSISAAAAKCGVGQPAASTHLRTLETSVGKRLVARTGRGSSLTVAGKIVASHAADVLATLERMRGALDELDASQAGQLTIAASLMPSVALVPAILRQFSDRHPGVKVKMSTAPSDAVVGQVAFGSADVGIAGPVTGLEGVVRRQVMMDELVGIAPVGLFNPEDCLIARRDFARASLLLGGQGSSTRLVAERCLARAGCRPARLWSFDSYAAIKRAVADGLGISFISKLLVADEIARGELAPVRVHGVEPMMRPIYALHSAAGELRPAGAEVLTLLLDAERSLLKRGHRRHSRGDVARVADSGV